MIPNSLERTGRPEERLLPTPPGDHLSSPPNEARTGRRLERSPLLAERWKKPYLPGFGRSSSMKAAGAQKPDS